MTLADLAAHQPELGLKVVWPHAWASCQATEVSGLTPLSTQDIVEGEPQRHLPAGHLVLITGSLPRVRGRVAIALEILLEQMRLDDCSALVVSTTPGGHLPRALHDLCVGYGVPLLTTTASPGQWRGVRDELQSLRASTAERHADQLSVLLERLPLRLADPSALQRLADGLSQILGAHVLVSEPAQVLAASPQAAAEHLAPAIICQSATGTHPGVAHTQLISLTSTPRADIVLAVARSTPFTPADLRVLRTAARLMGLIDQAHREYRAAADASRTARTAAGELLLNAEVGKARAVMDKLAPGLLSPETARVFVIETSPERRQAAVQRCEALTADLTLTMADPRHTGRFTVIQPIHPDTLVDTVPDALTRLVHESGPGASLGGSGVYSLPLLSEALHEACAAQRLAARQPDAVVLSAQHTDLLGLLPRQHARLWAHHLLRPLMRHTNQWDQFRDTLPTELAHPNTVAARLLQVHRNTVKRHLTRAAELLSMDLGRVHHRVAVHLALEIVTQRSWPAPDDDTPAASLPLPSLLTGPELHAWATALLRPAHADPRPLLTTATSWLDHGTHIEPAARALGLSEATVRTHLRALENHTGRNLASVEGIRDLHFALYISTGAPAVTDPANGLAAAA
ncbi:helix-turn-helix domain-containing protein [Streptomyces sp. MNP-20]|uniref:helix-turn-helix domain-containing protein n=1 Tax=Streptomyces sp. MNP-20 TaxID=2721165 RepID=UPI0020A684EA|nr:helix-turn-helix domain-containing protein [Streptomyces sp. MNP-20]